MTRLGHVAITNLLAGSAVALLAGPIVTMGSLFWAHVSSFSTSQLWWFGSSNPAGVKLHPQLSGALSMAGLWYIAMARSACVALRDASLVGHDAGEYNAFHGLVVLVGILTGLKGPRVLGRAVGLLTLPITLASAAMYHTARVHVWLTGLLWRFMREDGSAYKLALSCLLFMPVVLTLPTTLWYGVASDHSFIHSFTRRARLALSRSHSARPVSDSPTRYGIFVCGMGAVAQLASQFAASLVVVHMLRAGPLVSDPIGSFLPLTRARGGTT